MNQQTKQTLWNIINCGLNEFNNPQSVCNRLICSQAVNNINSFQIPEPWSGDIENAPILFVSLNPGYNPDEKYPMLGDPYWATNGVFNKKTVEDFFEKRFAQIGVPPYVKINKTNGITNFETLQQSGQYSKIGGRYWRYIQRIANKILNKQSSVFGEDFTLTELVHCKSDNISHISPKCYEKCCACHFGNVLGCAKNLKYLVVIGANTRKVILNFGIIAGLSNDTYTWHSTLINDKPVNVIFVPHNAGGGTANCIQYPIP